MNPLILAMTYKERGKQKIYDTMDEIQQKTTNILDVLHNIADWEKVNIKPTYSSVYYYPFFPYFVFRKTPPRAEYTILVRQGACEEHAVLFRALAEKSGVQCRVLHNKGEDHTWTEIYYNGGWVHFDPTLNRDYRFNNSIFYESSIDMGWGKNISYVYYEDNNGSKIDITRKYTDVSTVKIKVTKNGVALKNAKIYVYSKYLMESERFGDIYKKPKLTAFNETDDHGSSSFDLGGNNYLIKVTSGTLFKRSIKKHITIVENIEMELAFDF